MSAFFSKLISLVFHPLLTIIYAFALTLAANPYAFGYNSFQEKTLLLLFVFFTAIFIPLIAIFMMLALKLIPDLNLRDKRDRIFPFIATGIFYLWLIVNIWSNPAIPPVVLSMCLGLVISLFLGFFINNFEKISVHTLSAGNIVAIVLITAGFFADGPFKIPFRNGTLSMDWTLLIALSILLAAAIGSARIFLKNYRYDQITTGYFVGFACQWIAFFIMNR